MSDVQLIAGFFYLILGILAVAFLLASVLVSRSEKRKARDCTVPVTAEIIEIQKRWMDLDADTGYRISIGWYCFINGIGGRICYSSKDYNRLIGRDETRDGGRENPKVENDGGTETDDAE